MKNWDYCTTIMTSPLPYFTILLVC